MLIPNGECNYLLSGKLPTVRQATYSQASYLQSGKLPTVRQSYLLSGKATYCQAKLPTVRQSYLQSGKAAYSQACTQQPHTCTQPSHRHARGIDMHPKVSIDLHPTSAYFAPNGEGSIFKKYNI